MGIAALARQARIPVRPPVAERMAQTVSTLVGKEAPWGRDSLSVSKLARELRDRLMPPAPSPKVPSGPAIASGTPVYQDWRVVGRSAEGFIKIEQTGKDPLAVTPGDLLRHNPHLAVGQYLNQNLLYVEGFAPEQAAFSVRYRAADNQWISTLMSPEEVVRRSSFFDQLPQDKAVQVQIGTHSFRLDLPSSVREDEVVPVLHAHLSAFPGEWAQHLKRVVIHEGPNPADAYWQQVYHNPHHVSLATGGNGTITYFNGTRYLRDPGTFYHEMGHVIGEHMPGGSQAARYPRDWPSHASKDRFHVSGYSRQNWGEDLAESVRVYKNSEGQALVHRAWRFIAPNRFAMLDDQHIARPALPPPLSWSTMVFSSGGGSLA